MNPSIEIENNKTTTTVGKSKKDFSIIQEKEHSISKDNIISSRITRNGRVKFCNINFTNSFGLCQKDNFNNSKHPDMPKIIFKIIEHNIENKLNSSFFIKNKHLNGSYFWTLSNFNPNKSTDLNIAYTLTCKKASAESVYQINKLYSKLSKIENNCGEKYALKFLIGFLEDRKTSFSEFNYLLSLT